MSDVRLIDANALEKFLNEKVKTLADENGWYDHFVSGFDDAITYVENAPTIDAVPVVHGRWNEPTWRFQDGFWVCSCCNFCTEASAAPRLYKYCPNCGSKMDSEE